MSQSLDEAKSVEPASASYLPAWTVGRLPEPPPPSLGTWFRLVGPGVLLAGASIGSGEWLFGPGVTAQYGSTLLWLATLSILGQVFCNLQMMRYAAYCGEPIVVGYLRTWPGPRFWMVWYALLDTAAIWPFNASNAAVPLAAVMLGHLPGGHTVVWLGMTMSEAQFVRVLGYTIFLLAFVPLVFGGTIYQTLERVMRAKLVIVLVYLLGFTICMVSWPNVKDVLTSFLRIGMVPIRAESIVAGRHFALSTQQGDARLTIKGSLENGQPAPSSWVVTLNDRSHPYSTEQSVPEQYREAFARLTTEANQLVRPGTFYLAKSFNGRTLVVRGKIGSDGRWTAESAELSGAGNPERFSNISELPAPWAARVRSLVESQGIERATIWGYWGEHHQLPPLDWAMLASFAAIAGAGGLTNTLFSNFARDAGWGMGAHVGAIPSAFGGLSVKLSHVGQVFHLDAENRQRWRGWLRHLARDQIGVWMFCSFLGMALPCMLSLEFIRHAPVSGNRVAALMADGMATRYPDHRLLLWVATLTCGFLVLAPGQILSGDQIARRWTDMLWVVSARARRIQGGKVQRIYYTILAIYGAWGLVALTMFNPLQIAEIAGVLMNFALGWSSLHAVIVNRTLLPSELRAPWWLDVGALLCGVFFIGISGIVLWNF